MDQSFNRATLARCLTPKDFYMDSGLQEEAYRRALVDRAVTSAHESNKFAPKLSVNVSLKKPIYSVCSLPEKLILRKCAKNIRIAAKIRLKPRAQIIKEAKAFLKEGTAYRIYRLDIASFFECCDSRYIVDLFLNYKISTQTQLLLESFLTNFNEKYCTGIPRGVETSPILSELALLDFDSACASWDEIFFYSRFVDDILIITSCDEDQREFLKRVRKSLPEGLNLNYNKTTIVDVPRRSCGIAQPGVKADVPTFSYLGYRISVIDTDLSLINPKKPSSLKTLEYRLVSVDLTDKKISGIMNKVSKAFYSFAKYGNYALLRDRLVFLSSNRDLINKVKNRKIPTGIYYSHSEIDYPSESIERIDRFLRVMIDKPQGRIGAVMSGKLSKMQKNELLKLKFSNGYENRVFKRYSPNRLSEISKIW